MGLSNGAKRARSYNQTINQNQGGGNKKAGFPYIIGRGWRTNIAFETKKHCTQLKTYQTLCFTNRVNQSRPIGSVNTGTVYWSRGGIAP